MEEEMSEPDYEYHGMMAETWDLFRGDTSTWEDRHFFLEIIRESGEPALDVGCGTGRLLLDYLSSGIDIEGVDNSPEMLDLCRQKAGAMKLVPTLHQASMESMSLPRKYRTIIVPSSSFQLILDEYQAQQAMQNFHAHLLPGGALVMPFMKLWKEGFESTWRLTGEKVRPEDGAVIKRWSRNWFDQVSRLEHTEDRYEMIKDGEIIAQEHHVRSPATREYSQMQARKMFSDAGFVDILIFKSFSHDPASEDDDVFTIMAKKHASDQPGS